MILPLLGTFFSIICVSSVLASTGFPSSSCLNPVVTTGQYASSDAPHQFQMSGVWVLARHMDRWMYEHSLIGDICWPHQINSSSPSMSKQCLDLNASSVWFQWPTPPINPDPYAHPLPGTCASQQLTRQGLAHAHSLGSILWLELGVRQQLLSPACPPAELSLGAAHAQQIEQTLQAVYTGLCRKTPNIASYSPHLTISDGFVCPHCPFWLHSAVCQQEPLLPRMLQEAAIAFNESVFLQMNITPAALALARVTQHPSSIDPTNGPIFLDNIFDCAISHACHALPDLPPGLSASLLRQVDHLETLSRVWPFTFFGAQAPELRALFSRLFYGQYFYVLHARFKAIIANQTDAVKLSLQVMSDSNISPLLMILGQEALASVRPPWGSTLIFELYRHHYDRDIDSTITPAFAVRVVYNGQPLTLHVCSCQDVMCDWDQFDAWVSQLFPSHAQCPEFYANFP
jgi:hypothetical protein